MTAPRTELDAAGEAKVCLGCGSTLSLAFIRSNGRALSCCPERSMVPVRELWNLAGGWINKPFVILESPYAGDVERNLAYARKAMADSLSLGEYPLASHLLYTQPGILDDLVPAERSLGIEAGLAWASRADKAVFYIGLGWSPGMRAAFERHRSEGRLCVERVLAP